MVYQRAECRTKFYSPALAIDSGVSPGAKSAVEFGVKMMAFNFEGELLKTCIIPGELYYDKMNLNDARINNRIGEGGYAIITDELDAGSFLSIDLVTGAVSRRLSTQYTQVQTRTM